MESLPYRPKWNTGSKMSKLYTFPNGSVLDQCNRITPDYMYPNMCPDVVISEEHLSDDICDTIIETFENFEQYKFTGCNAKTTEYSIPVPAVLNPITYFALEMNEAHFGYDLNPEPGAWGQTYQLADYYHKHMDGAYGQTRKLTAIAMLTDPETYTGGELMLHIHPNAFVAPNKRGTIIVFSPWLLHEVRAIESGVRQSINMGFWGPSFR
jgi:2OG-Fe(II) oxygenase superfamily